MNVMVQKDIVMEKILNISIIVLIADGKGDIGNTAEKYGFFI